MSPILGNSRHWSLKSQISVENNRKKCALDLRFRRDCFPPIMSFAAVTYGTCFWVWALWSPHTQQTKSRILLKLKEFKHVLDQWKPHIRGYPLHIGVGDQFQTFFCGITISGDPAAVQVSNLVLPVPTEFQNSYKFRYLVCFFCLSIILLELLIHSFLNMSIQPGL